MNKAKISNPPASETGLWMIFLNPIFHFLYYYGSLVLKNMLEIANSNFLWERKLMARKRERKRPFEFYILYEF